MNGERSGVLADGPAWSSSTSYYAGAPAYGPPAYGPPANDAAYGGQVDEWGAPTRGQYEPDPSLARESPYPSRSARREQARQSTYQRGLPSWGALLVLVGIAGIGGVIDTVAGNNVEGGFNIAIVLASIVAILLVRHRDMFPIVVAPPLVYFVASVGMLYLSSGGLHDRKALIDHAANWLVYGFPAIAGASAAVLIIAGIRLVFGK